MAQKLKPVTLVSTRPTRGLQIDTRPFWLGYSEGLRNEQPMPRFDLRDWPNEPGIVEIVLNLCEMWHDDELTEDQLHHDCGLIAGWLSRLAVQVDDAV